MSVMAAVRQLALSLYRSFFSWPHVASLERICAKHVAKSGATKTLDLGCGLTPKNPFHASDLYGVDVDYGIDESKHILPCDLGVEALPFPDEHFDYVTAFDLFEHIPRLIYGGGQRLYPFIYLMEEIHRVLKNDGILLSDTPAYPRFSAYTDPTHVNVITPETFRLYFCHPFNWAQRYGFKGEFMLLGQAWCKENLVTIMAKKPVQQA